MGAGADADEGSVRGQRVACRHRASRHALLTYAGVQTTGVGHVPLLILHIFHDTCFEVKFAR